MVNYISTKRVDRFKKEAKRDEATVGAAAAEQFPLRANVGLPDWCKGRALRCAHVPPLRGADTDRSPSGSAVRPRFFCAPHPKEQIKNSDK